MENPSGSPSHLATANLYTQSMNREHRGCLIFLLDQSGSMSVPAKGKQYNNADMATTTINNLIKTVVDNAGFDMQTGRRRDYCDLFIFGYGDQVHSLLDPNDNPISVTTLAENPRGVHEVLREEIDRSTGQIRQVKAAQPYWIQSFADSNRTEMAWALSRARNAAQNWIMADPKRLRSFPPIVINVTDGENNGQGDPIAEASQLRQLGTQQGQILLFNCHLTSTGDKRLSFPFDVAQVQHLGSGAEQLFHMASAVPDSMISRARSTFSIEVPSGARGFIYNADPHDLINFLNWGTRTRDTE